MHHKEADTPVRPHDIQLNDMMVANSVGTRQRWEGLQGIHRKEPGEDQGGWTWL